MKKIFVFLSSVLLFSSCVSIDMEKRVSGEEKSEVEALTEENKRLKESLDVYLKKEEYFYDVKPELIPVTKYIVLDEKDKETKATGKDAVRKSMDESIVSLEDYVGGTSFFDYDENMQFPIFTKQLRMTTIILNDDEEMQDGSAPFLSDTTRWEITGDVWETDKGVRQIIMVKPKASGLETNMLVVTNKRLYHFILYSTQKEYQPMVKFRYPLEKKFITTHTKKAKPSSVVEHLESVDMSTVSFNYKIKVPFFSRKVDWVPEKVYDDGSHTYIVIPKVALVKEFPAIWENGSEITNYEVHPDIHNMIVINKLIDKVTLRVGRKKVVITKKKGKAKDFSFSKKQSQEENKIKSEEEKEEVLETVNTDVGEDRIDSFNFNYKIVLEKGQKNEKWLPIKVYDNGENLFVSFKKDILGSENLSFYSGEDELKDFTEREEDNTLIFDNIPPSLVIKNGDKYAKIARFSGNSWSTELRR